MAQWKGVVWYSGIFAFTHIEGDIKGAIYVFVIIISWTRWTYIYSSKKWSIDCWAAGDEVSEGVQGSLIAGDQIECSC